MTDYLTIGFGIVSVCAVLAAIVSEQRRMDAVRLMNRQVGVWKELHGAVVSANEEISYQLNIVRRDLSAETRRAAEIVRENERLAELVERDGRIHRLRAFDAYRMLASRDHDYASSMSEQIVTFRVKPTREFAFQYLMPWDIERARREWPHTSRAMARKFAREIYALTVAEWEEQVVRHLAPMQP